MGSMSLTIYALLFPASVSLLSWFFCTHAILYSLPFYGIIIVWLSRDGPDEVPAIAGMGTIGLCITYFVLEPNPLRMVIDFVLLASNLYLVYRVSE